MSHRNDSSQALVNRPRRIGHGIALAGFWSLAVSSFAFDQAAIAGPVNLDGSTPGSQLSTPNCGASNCTVSSNASGDHYFHSFDSFTINEGVTLTFSAPAGVERIFSRLTGSASSIINGTLQVEGNANFFLISPNGLLIGRNGQIETGGSFTGSTARAIDFSNGPFRADNGNTPPLLTMGQEPIGLRFLGSSSGVEVLGATGGGPNDSPPIWLNREGGTFSLIGGRGSETYIERRILDIPDGGATLATVRSGLLEITNNGNGYDFDLPPLVGTLNNDVRLNNVIIRSEPGATQGNLTLYGDLISIDSSSEITLSAQQSDILLQGNDIELDNLELTQTAAEGGLTLDTTGSSGNNIELIAVNISLNLGNGDLTFNAGNETLLTTTDISFNTNSGDLTLNSGGEDIELTTTDISFNTNSGDLTLNSEDEIKITTTDISFNADSGNLALNASDDIELMTTDISFSTDNGNLTLNADEDIELATTDISFNADSGNLTLNTGDHILLTTTDISFNTDIGDITVNAGDDIDLTTTALSLNTDSGNLTVNAGNDIELTAADISLNTDSGDLALNAADKIGISTNSSVILETFEGSLDLDANTYVDIQNSEIILSLQGSPTSGSNLNVTTNELILRDGSLIQADFFDFGTEGGEINIDVEESLNISPFDDNDILIQGPSPRTVTFLDEQPSNSQPGLNTTDSSSFARGNGQSDIGYINTPPPANPPVATPLPTPPTPPSLGVPPIPISLTPPVTPTTPPPFQPPTSPPPSASNEPPQASSPDTTTPSVFEGPLQRPDSATASEESKTEVERRTAADRDRSYAIASLCQARKSHQLLISSDRGGIAASPRDLVMTGRSIADLGTTNVASTTPAPEYSPPDFATPSPLPIAEAIRWQTSPQGEIQLIAQGENHPIERFSIRCDDQPIRGIVS